MSLMYYQNPPSVAYVRAQNVFNLFLLPSDIY